MKIALLFVSFISLNYSNPKLTENITLDKNLKVESTFSGNTNEDNTFHLILAKNIKTKRYSVIPFLYKRGETVKLSAIDYKEEPSVLSFHNNNDILSLIIKSKEDDSEKIRVVDLDLISGEHLKSEPIKTKDFKTIIRKENKNILLFSNDDKISLITINSRDKVEEVVVNSSSSNEGFFKALSKNNIEAINNDEFITNGSIEDFRAYYEGNAVTITQEDTKEGITSLVQIPTNLIDDTKISVETFSNNSLSNKLKKSTSYYIENTLYQLKLRKDEVKLDVYGVLDNSLTTIDVLETAKNKLKESKSDFANSASKNYNQPTVSLNKTKDGNFKIRFDYVDKRSYNYRYNWWWHHHWMMNQMMWHQQQMQFSAPRFGPYNIDNPLVYDYISNQSSFEIGIDDNGNILDATNLETVYKYIDKKSYIDDLEDDKKLKHISTVFTKSNFRYIAFNKKTKTFIIKNKAIYD